ncbi:MAG TPA: mechanosensitive ion channel family protein [bacterium (Candidatus Stahlbacteria)]|nr:mechanosensitive ion channel family protein [Candidatus Stahlbacteria bacterium]
MHAIPNWLFGLFLLVAWIGFVFFLVPLLMKPLFGIARRTKSKLDDILIRSIPRPLTLVLIALGVKVFVDTVSLPVNVARYTRVAMLILFVFGIILFVDGLVVNWIREYRKRIEFVKTSSGVIKTLFRIIVFGVALLIILDSLGVSISPLLASLGIGSLAIALALQGTLSNLFSGLYILIDRPIKVGDYIRLESGEQGYVERIGWRSTQIRMLPNNIVVIPNAKLADTQIINYYLPEREMSVLVDVGVSYDSDLEHVESVTIDVAKKTLADIKGGVTEFNPFIRYHTFGDFSINFTVILRVKEYVDKYQVRHEFIKRLHKRYKEEGIEIPFPIRTVHLKQMEKIPEQLHDLPKM